MKDIYTIEEIRDKIASGDYNAELLLQHAMQQIQNLEYEVESLLYGDDY